MKKIIVITIFYFLLGVISIKAHCPTIRVSIDSSKIMIGEQVQIHLEITADKNQLLGLPMFQDTLTKGIEIISISKPDTIHKENNRIQIQYDYTITSFDSAQYLLPSFPLIVEKDTFYSDTLFLLVTSPTLKDTIAENFYDIKDIFYPQWIFADYLDIVWYTIGIGMVLSVIYIFIRKKKQKTILPFKKEKILISPHTRAIRTLDKIKGQKLWQQGKEKEYHSQISDVIRRYIDERFAIHAMEMTSEEILHAIKSVSEVQSISDDLQQLLRLADWVKFAKHRPLAEENELSITNAYLFIKKTIPAEILELGNNKIHNL